MPEVEQGKAEGDTSATQEQVSEGQAKTFTEEDVKKMLAETEQRLQKKFQQIGDREAGKWQAEAARSRMVAEQEARARQTMEAEAEALQQRYGEILSPEERTSLQLAELTKTLKRQRALPAIPAAVPQTVDGLAIVREVLKEHGIGEEEVDLATDAPDTGEALKRFTQSLVARSDKKVQAALKKAKEDSEAAVAKMRKESGIDMVDTSGGGRGSNSAWTREQLAEMSVEQYQKNKKEIDAALREGRIR